MKIDNGDRQDPIRFGFFRTSNNAEINPRISGLDLDLDLESRSQSQHHRNWIYIQSKL